MGNFCLSGYDTLDFTSLSANIKAVRLTGSLSAAGGPSRRALFDTLTFDAEPTAVPEPATLLMFGLGGGLFAAVRRRRAQKVARQTT
jgi:hypothetical protein